MESNGFNIDNYRHSIDSWWLMLILGLVMLVVGILVFMHPGESYLALGYVFAFVMIAVGVLQLYLGYRAPRHTGRGWLIAGGVVELLLGVLLVSNPAAVATVLPFLLGFWLIFRSITLIGTASDMMHSHIKGPGWVIFLAILLLVCAFMVLFNPIIGIGAIVIWVALSFLLAGIAMIVFGISLMGTRRHLRN